MDIKRAFPTFLRYSLIFSDILRFSLLRAKKSTRTSQILMLTKRTAIVRCLSLIILRESLKTISIASRHTHPSQFVIRLFCQLG